MPTYEFGELYFAGRWQPGGAAPLAVDNPWSGETVATIAAATTHDVDRAFVAASHAQRGWAAHLPSQRAGVFLRCAQIMEGRQQEIVDWLVRESGSTISKAKLEWWAVHNSVIEAATLPVRTEGRILFGDYPAKENLIYRIPVGVVAVISPWNWPLHLSMRTIAPALALGNAAVIKPAGDTPITGGLLIAKLFEEAGLPPGVLAVIAGRSSEIGDAFVAHPKSQVVSFTGSTDVGRRVGQLALQSAGIKRAMLELGGNGPLVVTDDVDVDEAVHTAIVGKFLHAGQMCIAINRIIVHERILDAFVEKFVARARSLVIGPATSSEASIGPIINRSQFDRIAKLVEDATGDGARLLLGEPARGLVMPPRVLDRVTMDMEIARHEIFGPVATILSADSDETAIRMANETSFGLTSGVLCRDLGRALRIAHRIEVGMTHINDIPAIDMPQMPFGGVKNSGIGRFGTRDVIDELTTQHWISIQHTPMPPLF